MTTYEIAYYYMDSTRNRPTADAFYDTAVYCRPLEQYSTDRLAMVAMYVQDLVASDTVLTPTAIAQLKAYLSKLEAYLKKPKAQGQGDSPTS